MQVRERGGRERGGRQKKGHKKLQGHLYINTSQDIKEKTERIAKGKQKIKRKERDRIETHNKKGRRGRGGGGGGAVVWPLRLPCLPQDPRQPARDPFLGSTGAPCP